MRTETIHNIRVGKADVKPTLPSHVKGVREGNEKGAMKSMAGVRRISATRIEGNALRSTGINAKNRNPIDPRMPNLSPP